MYEFREFYIPDRMMDGINRYIEHGTKPGSFLEAIITNDLGSAVANADDENIGNIPAYVAYFYNHTPQNCWGNAEKMHNWMDSKWAEQHDKENL